MDTAYASMLVKGVLCLLPYVGLLVLFVAGHYLIKRLARRQR